MRVNWLLRKSADTTLPFFRRVSRFQKAVGEFEIFGYQGTMNQLKIATGLGEREWTSERFDLAIKLIAVAYASWFEFQVEAAEHARRAKRLGKHVPIQRADLFATWRERYFDDETRSLWGITPKSGVTSMADFAMDQRSAMPFGDPKPYVP